MVYLTATLRPADEAEFGRLVGLPGVGKGIGMDIGAAKWFRGSTTRANIELGQTPPPQSYVALTWSGQGGDAFSFSVFRVAFA